MTRRERYAAMMAGQKTDRVMLDLAGVGLNSTSSPETQRGMARVLGFTEPYNGEYDRFDERVLEALDIDLRFVGAILKSPSAVPETPDGLRVDAWGLKRRFTGIYWELVDPPLKGATMADLDSYPWPDPRNIDLRELDTFREKARRLWEETDYVVCGSHPVYGVMELGCWMCGFDEFLLKMALEPEFVLRFFDIFWEYQRQVITVYYQALGEYIHLTGSGDDFGTQTGPFISPAMFSELVAPYYKKRIDLTKRYTSAHYLHHTCGAVFPLIPSLIEAGVDILNPIQPGAAGMEPEALLAAYGERIAFHGGVDTQHLLPEGTPADVEKAVFALLEQFDGHAYFLSPAHNVQPDVPPENVVAIYKAAQAFYARQG